MLRTKIDPEFEMVQLQYCNTAEAGTHEEKEMMEYSEESYKSLSDGFDAADEPSTVKSCTLGSGEMELFEIAKHISVKELELIYRINM